MAMSVGEQFASSLTGNIEQAIILIYDYRGSLKDKRDATLAKISTLVNKDNTPKVSPEGIKKLKSNSLKKMNDFRNAATAAENEGIPFVEPSATKTFHVHFNPSQIQVYASSIPEIVPDAKGGEPVHDSVTKARMNMSVNLFFDEMNVYDSFMADKFTMGATVSGAKNVAAAIMSATGKKKWSVQDEVEGLIAALRDPYTRNVSFRWAEFAFTGQLTNVSAKYTMFSTSGHPVRAQVLLRIQHEMDDVHLKRWYDNYNEVFKDEGSSLTGISQKMGNLMNINL